MNYAGFLLNVLGGVWTRVFFGFAFEALFQLSPLLWAFTFLYVLYIVMAMFCQQFQLWLRNPGRRLYYFEEGVVMFGSVVGLVGGLYLLPPK